MRILNNQWHRDGIMWASVAIAVCWHNTIWPRAKQFLAAIAFWLLLSAIGVFLSGCAPWFAPNSGAVNALIDTGIEETADDIASANDRLSRILERASCGISLGAYSRLRPTQQWGFLALCIGQTPENTPAPSARNVLNSPIYPPPITGPIPVSPLEALPDNQ